MTPVYPVMGETRQQLERLATLVDGWDGDGALSPKPKAIEMAYRIAATAWYEGVEVLRVSPSVDNGAVGLTFDIGDRYADVECDGNGRAVAAITTRDGQSSAWNVDPLSYADVAITIHRLDRTPAQ